MGEKRAISVRILGQEYRVRSEADEALVQRAAGLVDETMQRIQTRTGTVDSLDLAVLTALNLANRVVVVGRAPELAAPVDTSRLRELVDLAESALEEGAAPRP